jgi:hypothetical protein
VPCSCLNCISLGTLFPQFIHIDATFLFPSSSLHPTYSSCPSCPTLSSPRPARRPSQTPFPLTWAVDNVAVHGVKNHSVESSRRTQLLSYH